MWVSDSQLRSERKLDELAGMRLPAGINHVGFRGFGFTTDLCWRIAFERSVNSTVVIIFQEYAQAFSPSHQCSRITSDQEIKQTAFLLYPTTVAKSGSTPSTHSRNSLTNVKNPVTAAVLAEPSPWTVIQGVTLLLR